MKNLNYLEPTKEILEGKRSLIIEKISKVFKYLIAALLFGSIFFAYEFLEDHSPEYIAKKTIADKLYKQNSASLKLVKDYAIGTEVYNNYKEVNSRKRAAVADFIMAKKNEKVFGFKTLKLFTRDFCLFLGFFCYTLFNLFRSFYFDRKNVGVKVIHGFLISVCLFYFLWLFQPFEDLSNMSYYFMTFVSAAFVVLAVYLITKYYDHRVNRLKKSQYELAKFTFKNTKPEKREEMLDTIERVIKTH